MSGDGNTSSGSNPGAEGINVLYTGLPAYHPLAIAEGWNAALVDEGVRNSTIDLVQAGYNWVVFTVIAAGPEISMDVIAEKIRAKGVEWHVTGIGMGVRAAKSPTVIHYLEGISNPLFPFPLLPSCTCFLFFLSLGTLLSAHWLTASLVDLVHLFRRETPGAQQVFNSGPASVVESVRYRVGQPNHGRPGKLIGYEEVFDGQKGRPLDSVPPREA
ncbi:hypothetical protein BP6252_10908 [Coleophoma cylindrospora]|uniref:Uncharacterized protein n=1 Tax=Coleophoma cylindrospora TaxID=1849047 RepID=A0A3D8QNG1_9HELO|nr:hypothetical protein BP6252_10908 [Coleophoma cylindrospora]